MAAADIADLFADCAFAGCSPAELFAVHEFSAGKFCCEEQRQALEKRYLPLLEVSDKFSRQSVSFQLSKKDVLHSWLKYKEGLSASLVNTLLDELQVKSGDIVLDPFMGSGTTALVCNMRGIHCRGYDVMPLSAVALQAKTHARDYSVSELQQLLSEVSALRVPEGFQGRARSIPITQDAYPLSNDRFLAFIEQWNRQSSYSAAVKNLLTLCIINSLENCSYTAKSGQYLSWDSRSAKIQEANIQRLARGQKPLPEKRVRSEIADLQTAVVTELAHVIEDIRCVQRHARTAPPASIDFKTGSVLFELPRLTDNSLNAVITSPPYCNRYDYTRTYALELVYLGLDDQAVKQMRQNLLSCTVENRSKLAQLKDFYASIGKLPRFEYIVSCLEGNQAFSEVMQVLRQRKEHGDLNNNGVLRMVEGYFTELGFIYAELFRLCKSGAGVAFVNDNVRYGGEVIPVDFLSCSLAEQFGFKVQRIHVLRQQKGNSSQQMARFGKVALRKSITVWTKP